MKPLVEIVLLIDLQWKLIIFILGTPFPFNETTSHNRLESKY
jgi:hypothetical protein